ncbi:MAG: T9SS type A sorting domain-containing protein [Bacteroidota bacterium]
MPRQNTLILILIGLISSLNLSASSAPQMLTFEASVGLASTFCTDPMDPNNCLAVPSGSTTITIDPNAVEDIVISYRLDNNTGATIVQGSVTDSQFGVIIPAGPTTILPGAVFTETRRFTPPTVPGTYNVTATLVAENSAGNSQVLTADYTIEVLGGDPAIEVFPLVAEGICTDTTDLATCGVAPTSTPSTLTLAPGDIIYLEYRLQNMGTAAVTNHSFTDSRYGLLHDSGATSNPGSDLRFRELVQAPTSPGTYNITVDYQGTDDSGNNFNRSANYTLIVEEPEVEIFVYPILAEDICTDTTDLATCGVAPTSTPTTLTLAPGDIIYLEFRILNTGIVTLTNNDWDDQFYGLLFDDNGTNIRPGADIRFRSLLQAPTSPGIYNINLDYIGEDDFGNSFTASTTYTLIVEAPEVEVFAYPILAEDICTDTTDLATCGVAPTSTPTTLTLAPGDIIYLEFRILNTGIVTLTNNDWDDQFYGLLFDDNGTNIRPGADIRFRSLLQAPTSPGTYNITLDYIGEDDFGNSFTTSTTYTLIVEAPEVEVFAYPILAEDICTDTEDLATCGVAPTSTPSTLTLGPGQKIYLELRIVNTGIVTLTNNDWDDSLYGLLFDDNGTNIRPGNDIRFRQLLDAPSTPGTYNITIGYLGLDDFGNSVSLSTAYTLIVDCALGDEAPPQAVCQDRSYTLGISEMVMISPDQIDDGSTDGCSANLDFQLSQTTFDCSDVGVQTVTLNVRDQANNVSSCTAEITILPNDIFAGNTFCIAVTEDIQGLNNQWIPVFNAQGKRLASIDPGTNTNLAQVRISSRRAATTLLDFQGEPYLGRRITIEFRNAAGQVVQPNDSPVGVRLFYTDEEGDALFAADPGSTGQTLAVLKTDQGCSPMGYDGTGVEMNISNRNGQGCGRNYLQFFTGSFSTFYLFADNDALALPVEWLAFSARVQGQQAVQLDWATASESDNSHFIIERSADGRQFQAIGELAGVGNSSQRQNYSWLDTQPLNGNNFYRLRQVDFSGEEQLSEVRMVSFGSSTSAGLTLFPNPTVDQVYLDGFAGGEVRLYDLQGRLIKSLELTPGAPLSVEELLPGTYLLRAVDETQPLRLIKR